jgi:restriction system protein
MSWLILLGFLLLLSIPWLLQKRADRKHRKRIQTWRKNSSPIRRGDSIDLMLRTFSVERETKAAQSESPVVDDSDQPRPSDPEAEPAQKTVRVLPPVEYHWLKKNHRLNIQAARQELKELRAYAFTAEPDDVLKIVIGTLRRTKPFVFEEMLLHCFKEQGWKVVRNERYTGDDGIDGRLYREGKLYFAQAKRYSGLIQAAHMQKFESVIQEFGAIGGFFVHTGRTDDRSKGISRQPGSKIILVKGVGVVDLVLHRNCP